LFKVTDDVDQQVAQGECFSAFSEITYVHETGGQSSLVIILDVLEKNCLSKTFRRKQVQKEAIGDTSLDVLNELLRSCTFLLPS
jgi:hypothetical protein